MATCTLTYSTEVARRAFRTYFWKRFSTPLGLFYLFSFPLIIGAVWFAYSFDGANWFVGAFGLAILMNLSLQGIYYYACYFAFPKAFARRLSDPMARTAEVETSLEGIRILSGPNAALLTWARFKYIWLYDDFVLMAAKPPMFPVFFIPTNGMTPEVHRDLEAAGQGRSIA
jgi:hypothetical protein